MKKPIKKRVPSIPSKRIPNVLPDDDIFSEEEKILENLWETVHTVTRKRSAYKPLDIQALGVAIVYFLKGECEHFDLLSKPHVCALCGVRF